MLGSGLNDRFEANWKKQKWIRRRYVVRGGTFFKFKSGQICRNLLIWLFPCFSLVIRHSFLIKRQFSQTGRSSRSSSMLHDLSLGFFGPEHTLGKEPKNSFFLGVSSNYFYVFRKFLQAWPSFSTTSLINYNIYKKTTVFLHPSGQYSL